MWFPVIVVLGFHLVQFSLNAIMTGSTTAPSFIFSSTNSKQEKKNQDRAEGLSTKGKDQMKPPPQQVASFEITFWMKSSKNFTKLSN